jgi:dephospho-CoA kinase
MLKVGLTGGIGSGKSTAVDAFRVLGVPIIDADQIAKDIVKKGQPALIKIAKTFGKDILLSSGELDRKALKQRIFSHSKSLTTLEAILHPYIKTTILQHIKTIESAVKPPPYVIVDIPLLVEKNYQSIFDHIIVVDCSAEQQIKRVIQRDGLDEEIIKKIMQKQVSRLQRKQAASHILDNSKDVDNLTQQVNQLHQYFVSD